MNNQGFPLQVSGAEPWCHHAGVGLAVVIHHQPAEIAPVTISEGAEMLTRFVRVPVTSGSQAGNRCALGGFAHLTASRAVEMEAMFPRAQPRQIGINHQALVGVLRCDAADRLANAVDINALQGYLNGSAPARSEREQADEQNELGEQATHHRTASS